MTMPTRSSYCATGDHVNCTTTTWDNALGGIVDCGCDCHEYGDHDPD